MNISAEEKLMYEVMRAIYDSGIPVSFKGSMVLKACLLELGYTEDTRHTVDIDGNWNADTPPTVEQMRESLQNAIDSSGITLTVSIYRNYGEGRSAGFELADKDTGEILFTMDMDVNRPASPTKIYEVADMRFSGVVPIQMLSDKVVVTSTDKVFRRIKDVIDLYYLSGVFAFNRDAVMEAIKKSGKEIGDFNGFLFRTEELRHAYEKFRFSGEIDKPSFDRIYEAVKAYINALLPN